MAAAAVNVLRRVWAVSRVILTFPVAQIGRVAVFHKFAFFALYSRIAFALRIRTAQEILWTLSELIVHTIRTSAFGSEVSG